VDFTVLQGEPTFQNCKLWKPKRDFVFGGEAAITGKQHEGGEAEGEAPPPKACGGSAKRDLEAKPPKCYIRAKRDKSRQQNPLITQRRAFARHVNYAIPLSVKGCALRVASQVGVRLRRPADRNP